MHPTEAEGYFLNITSDTPLVFVMWRSAEDGSEPAALPEIVTVSYNQAGRILDGGEHVDPVPMPEAILAWMRPFVAEHYKPEPRRKVKRNDPFKDGAFQRDRPRARLNTAAPLHMADEPETPEPFSLKRWSQRKRAATQTPPAQTLPPRADGGSAVRRSAVADRAPAAVPEPLAAAWTR